MAFPESRHLNGRTHDLPDGQFNPFDMNRRLTEEPRWLVML